MNRESIEQWAKDSGISIRGHYDETGSTISELKSFATKIYEAATKKEREACLDICSTISEDDFDLAGQVAMEIAKRGEK